MAASPQSDGTSPTNPSQAYERTQMNGLSSKKTPSVDWTTLDACVSSGDAHRLLVRRRRKQKEQSLFGAFRGWVVQHQKGLSVNLLLLHALAYLCFPRVRLWTRPFVHLSYYDSDAQTYTRGTEDFFFVGYWIVMFTALRATVMTSILMPLASSVGIQKIKTKVRFTEQAWLFIYYAVFWPLGMYVWISSDYWFNLREMWTGFPARSIDGLLKWYYLVQFAFWLQQIVVIHLEHRRKDHWQMFTHHIVTSLLLSMSYGFYQTRVGNVILCCMDAVDMALSTTKMLNYAKYQTACDVVFCFFITLWFATRHVCYLVICWSVWADVPETVPYGCYSSKTGERLDYESTLDTSRTIMSNTLQPFLDPAGTVCFTKSIHYTFLGLLLSLQVITVVWFGMIVRVAWRVINGNGADDSRSDDEAEVEDLEEEASDLLDPGPPVPIQPVEELVGVEGLNLKRRGSPRYRNRKAGSHTGGISISGHSDRKELLGRIGCDKPS